MLLIIRRLLRTGSSISPVRRQSKDKVKAYSSNESRPPIIRYNSNYLAYSENPQFSVPDIHGNVSRGGVRDN